METVSFMRYQVIDLIRMAIREFYTWLESFKFDYLKNREKYQDWKELIDKTDSYGFSIIENLLNEGAEDLEDSEILDLYKTCKQVLDLYGLKPIPPLPENVAIETDYNVLKWFTERFEEPMHSTFTKQIRYIDSPEGHMQLDGLCQECLRLEKELLVAVTKRETAILPILSIGQEIMMGKLRLLYTEKQKFTVNYDMLLKGMAPNTEPLIKTNIFIIKLILEIKAELEKTGIYFSDPTKYDELNNATPSLHPKESRNPYEPDSHSSDFSIKRPL